MFDSGLFRQVEGPTDRSENGSFSCSREKEHELCILKSFRDLAGANIRMQTGFDVASLGTGDVVRRRRAEHSGGIPQTE